MVLTQAGVGELFDWLTAMVSEITEQERDLSSSTWMKCLCELIGENTVMA